MKWSSAHPWRTRLTQAARRLRCDGASVVLEFSANVSGKALKGIDMVRFNAEGKIGEFEVMVRPASGLQALGAAMGAKLGDKLALLKAEA
ncbi:hypothetical protein DL770_011349 [Monosporascus sp. CRB-9-2]|nr:hypothetical protein DL770_011349 [Monosporascus sp. CRB-9-2]